MEVWQDLAIIYAAFSILQVSKLYAHVFILAYMSFVGVSTKEEYEIEKKMARMIIVKLKDYRLRLIIVVFEKYT